MTDDTYNGWTNRETWALALHVDNEEWLYTESREAVRRGMRENWHNVWSDGEPRDLTQPVAEEIKDWWEQTTDPDDGILNAADILTMVRDIGSEYRVNWDEIADNWMSEYMAEMTEELGERGSN